MRTIVERISRDAASSWTYFARSSNQFDVVHHRHPEIELTLVRGGEGIRQVAGSVDRFSDGDLVLVGPNVPHAYWTEKRTGRAGQATRRCGEVVWYTVQFRAEFLGDLFRTSPEFSEIHRMLTTIHAAWHFPSISDDVIDLFASMGTQRMSVRTARLIEALAHLAESERVPLAASGSATTNAATHRLRTVLDFVREHHQEPIDLQSVAGMAAMSEGGFSRFFSQAMGQPFTAYVSSVRLDAASRALLSTDDPIAVVAAHAGFSNLSNFNRRFREVHGVTPREYRRRSGLLGATDR